MKQKPTQSRGFTLVELLVVISIIALLAGLSFPALQGALVQANLFKAVSNGQELYKAALAANLDANNTGNYAVGFPGDMNTPPADAVSYINSLRVGGFLTGDYYKLLSVDTVPAVGESGVLTPRNIAYSVGLVSNNSAENMPFLTTKNFTPVGGGKLFGYVPVVIAGATPAPTSDSSGTPASGTDASTSSTTPPAAGDATATATDTTANGTTPDNGSLSPSPFKNNGFVVIRKGGDGNSYKPKDVSTHQGGAETYIWGLDPSKSAPPVTWLQTPER